MDEDALRRLLVAGHAASLSLAESSPLFDQAVRAVIDNPDTRPPEPIPENRPPRPGGGGPD